MIKKAYHLRKCSTCQRILSDLNWQDELQEIRSEKITPEQIDEMSQLAGSYEALFNRRAVKYRSMGLKQKILEEKDYRELILSEETFLKRPVFLIKEQIFIGNSNKSVEAAQNALNG